MVVLNRSESRALFGNKEKGAGDRRLGWADIAFSEVIVDIFFQGKGFGRGKAVNAAFLHGCVRFQINGMVPWLMLWESFRSLFAED